MEFEKSISSTLLSEAHLKKQQEKMQKSSEERAQKEIPTLVKKISSLLFAENLESQEDTEKQKLFVGNNLEGLVKSNLQQLEMEHKISFAKHFMPTIVSFLVPVKESEIAVTLDNGEYFSKGKYIASSMLKVSVAGIDSHLEINDTSANIVSNARYRRSYESIPMGSSGDIGPVWTRPMNMDEASQYNALLDRLAQSDVKRA